MIDHFLLFETIPNNVRCVLSLLSFMSHLKMHLFVEFTKTVLVLFTLHTNGFENLISCQLFLLKNECMCKENSN